MNNYNTSGKKQIKKFLTEYSLYYNFIIKLDLYELNSSKCVFSPQLFRIKNK